jgi:hypothetical protein
MFFSSKFLDEAEPSVMPQSFFPERNGADLLVLERTKTPGVITGVLRPCLESS